MKQLNHLLKVLCLLIGLLISIQCIPQNNTLPISPKIGVFYFPGWKNNALGLGTNKPWERIQDFPQREPLLSWYDEGKVSVMEQHLKWMQEYAIDFVVFDWFWGGGRTVLDHAVNAYLQTPLKHKTPYALMWSNHGAGPKSKQDFILMIQNLIEKHFPNPEYLKVNGMPVFFIMTNDNLVEKSKLFGSTTDELITEAHILVKKAGYSDVKIVIGAGGGTNSFTGGNALKAGFGGYFAYNYHSGINGKTMGEPRLSHSYDELDKSYREHWNWFMKNTDLPYIIPMTSGWDKRAWGGSKDPLHDESVSSPEQFKNHIQYAHDLLVKYPEKTLGMGIICCWNEFGEGSIIEPTKTHGFKYLEAVRDVFGKN